MLVPPPRRSKAAEAAQARKAALDHRKAPAKAHFTEIKVNPVRFIGDVCVGRSDRKLSDIEGADVGRGPHGGWYAALLHRIWVRAGALHVKQP
mgnify:CR=1 FL=1